MKCPRCDTDVTGKRKCSKCGLDVAGSQEEIEVEYKDFKTSELLEIRHKKLADRKHAEIKTVGEHNGGKALKRELSGETFCKEEKKPFPSICLPPPHLLGNFSRQTESIRIATIYRDIISTLCFEGKRWGTILYTLFPIP